MTTPLVVTLADLQPNSVGLPPAISPKLLEPHRLTGKKNITPDAIQPSMNLRGSFKICLDVEGHAADIKVLQSTGHATYDRKIVAHMWQWSFTPVVLDGNPIPVCTAATFIFTTS
jgi:hypothetical protein